MNTIRKNVTLAVVAAVTLGSVLSVPSSARAQGWLGVFNPNQLLTLNLTMDPADWDTVRFDLTFDIE
ncbi:MAG: hypothetical protein V3T70_10545, partial [Phycisphaerae bacterium]